MRMSSVVRWLSLGSICATIAGAAPVNVVLGTGPVGTEIPADFVGLSFEISNLLPDKSGRRMFSAENRALIALFRAAGIKSLRIGGGTAEPKSSDPAVQANYPIPNFADIDDLFAFAEAADVKVIYTLRLLLGSPRHAAALARYIAEHYASRLDSFSLGNEPDWHAYHTYPGHLLDPEIVETDPGVPGSAYPSYLAQWRKFAIEILQAVPEAKFSGPNTGSNFPVPGSKDTDVDGRSWTEQFVADVRGPFRLTTANHHDYVGQSASGITIPDAVDAMLSPGWLAINYPALFDHVLAPVQLLGVSYRMTECNDHTGGVDGASNAFVSALWALDYMHWHAARGAQGVNFHNKRWIYTCTIIQDSAGEYRLNPKGYGFKAFSLGSRGRSETLTLGNRDSLNLTAYAVRGATEHFLTLINKEHGARARGATVSIALPAPDVHAEVMLLTVPDNDPAARAGMTLGGAAIDRNGSWQGEWTPLTTNSKNAIVMELPPTSAAVVRISPASH